MVTAEVREHGNLELQCLDAFHGDCVRRDFHYGVFPSRIDHLSEEFFQFGRLRGCPFRWESESSAPIFDRAKCGGGHIRCFQNRLDQIRCRRLSIGARDSNQVQLGGRMTVEVTGHSSKRNALVVDFNPRHRKWTRSG